MIIDSHTHFYDPSRPGGVPFPSEDSSIYRTVLPKHFREKAGPLDITGTVVVEDNQWILDIAADDTAIVGFIGNIDIRSHEFQKHVSRFASNPIFRGVRARCYGNRELFSDVSKANLIFLGEKNLTLEILVQPDELELAERLAGKHPSLKIILDHIAHVSIDGNDPDKIWKDGISRCSGCGNVYVKLSRLPECTVQRPAVTDPAYYRPSVKYLWDTFGPDRLVWGSNWPVAEYASDYAVTLSVVTDFLKDMSPEERENVLWRNSQSIYGWKPR